MQSYGLCRQRSVAWFCLRYRLISRCFSFLFTDEDVEFGQEELRKFQILMTER